MLGRNKLKGEETYGLLNQISGSFGSSPFS
jgi:hypothetical protein